MNLDIRLIKDRKEKGNVSAFVKQKEENYLKKNYNGEKTKNMHAINFSPVDLQVMVKSWLF